MTRYFTEDEVIALIGDLTSSRLSNLVKSHFVTPAVTSHGPGYAEADLARLQLLTDLVDVYELPDDTLTMVMSLIDQLNTARGDMRALMQAVAAEPDEVRGRITQTVHSIRVVRVSSTPSDS